MELKSFFAQDDAGNILSAATCYVYMRGTESLVTGLKKANGVELANPFKTDLRGLAEFVAPNGLYDVRVVKDARDFRIAMQFNDVAETVEAAKIAAVRAEVAADISTIASNQCSTIEEGLQKTSGTGPDNRFFSIVSEGNSVVTWYRNDAGVGVKINDMSSRSGVLEALDAVSNEIGVVLDPIAASIKRQDTQRSGWVGAETDKLKRMLSAIKVSTGGRHHFITQVFDSAISVSKVNYDGQSVAYKRVSPRSGWLWGSLDKFKRVYFGQKIDGSIWAWGKRLLSTTDRAELEALINAPLAMGTVKYDGESVTYKRSFVRSGWLWGRLDKFKRVYFGQKLDGSIWAWGKRLLSTTDRAELEVLIAAQTPAPVISQVFQSGDTDGRQQIFIRNLVSGVTRQLSAGGSNNVDLQVTADGLNVMYTSDRTEGLGPGRLAIAIAGGVERLVSPRRDRLTTIGDSLTFGQGATNTATESWPAVVGSTQGWVVTNRALQGFTSRSQAALVGAIPTLVTAAGDSVGGGGAVTVLTTVSTTPLSIHNGAPHDSGTRTVTGTLVGVHGTLSRRPVGTSGAYTDLYEFISDAATATTVCPAGSVFVPDGDQRNEVLGICLGTNRGIGFVESDDVVKANVAAIIQWAAPLYPKILLFGLAKSSALNAYWRNTFPQYYVVDSSGRDLYQRLLASGDGSAKDLEYLALGRIPYSLLGTPDSGDYIHLSTAGYSVWAQLANEVIQVRGYSL